MASLGGVDLSQLLTGVQQGLGDLMNGFRPETQNAALAGNDGARQGPDLFAGLSYGGQATAYTPPQSNPFQGLRVGGDDLFDGVFGGGADLFGDLSYGDPDLFGGFREAKAKVDAGKEYKKKQDEAEAAIAGIQGGATGGTGGSYDSPWGDKHEQYRAYIQQYAAAEGLDPDALAAMLWIETDGDPRSVSHAGAQGLGQIMPNTWAGLADPGDDPFNAEHSIKNAARYFAQQYRAFGSYENAAAAYLGGPGGVVNGRPNPNNNDGPGGVGGNSSASYAAIFNRNLGAIKSSAPKTAPYTGGGAGASSIWGGQNASITQAYGVVTPGIDQGIYGYGATYGLPQGHTGWDVGLARGTQLYMPAGLTGVVETAGGTPYFLDEDYGDRGTPGKGELRIRLSNGDILILGHTSQIGVQVGQQVTGGQAVALVGSASGDHLHLEVRVRQPDGSYRLIDPGQYFGGH